MLVHIIDGKDEDHGLCGHVLLPEDAPVPDWTEDREDATCDDCATRYDEAHFEHDEERRLQYAGAAADDRAADRQIEDALLGGAL